MQESNRSKLYSPPHIASLSKEIQMKKIAAISLLLLLSLLLFVSPAETKRGHTAFASADLSVTKVDSPDPVNPGSNLTYTITVTNNGPDAGANASWNNKLTPGPTFGTIPNIS